MRNHLPPPLATTLRHVVVALIEVVCGLRPASQVAAFVAPALRLRLAHHAASRHLRGAPGRTLRLYGQRTHRGDALELWGHIDTGSRQLAYAARVELHDRAWRVVDFRLLA